jgi:hypothetical protein
MPHNLSYQRWTNHERHEECSVGIAGVNLGTSAPLVTAVANRTPCYKHIGILTNLTTYGRERERKENTLYDKSTPSNRPLERYGEIRAIALGMRLGGWNTATAAANLGSSCLTVTKSQAVSKPLRQMKECSVFKHTYAL